MSTLLVGATLFSLFLAAVMTAIASKVLRENRARSAARVATLQALADETSPAEAPAYSDEIFDFALRTESATPSAPALFEESVQHTPGFRWRWVAAVGLVMAAGAGAFYGVASGGVGRVFAAGAAKPAVASASPIELLSLRHAIDASGNFTVTGLVQNPAASASLHGVFAVVYLFDAEGRYFAHSRAALESVVLSPGGESAFMVRVPLPSLPAVSSVPPTTVSRYRVSFQAEDGAAINHVDRRGALPDGTTGDAVQTPAAAPAVTTHKN